MLLQILAALLLFIVVLGDDVPSMPEQKSVEVGESLTIPCPLSTPGDSVQWLQNGAAVVLDPTAPRRRQWAVGAEGSAALAIVSARPVDAGRWECRELTADGGVKRVAHVMELTVGSSAPSPGSPSDPYLELEGRRLLHQAQLTVREPQSLSLHCVVSGANPAVRRIHWYLDDLNLTSSSELFVEFVAEEEAYESRSVLRLNASRRFHRKDLVCRVQHVSWLQAAAVSASLNVLYEPSFSISREPGFGFPLSEGMRAWLRCEVDANPPSPPRWVRDDGPIGLPQDDLGFLNFSSIEGGHSGWYRCTTQHPFGFFASFGYFLNVRSAELPDPTDSGSNLPGEVGTPLHVRCPADGRPEVTAVNKSLLVAAGQPALLTGQLCSSPEPTHVLWILRDRVLRPGDLRPHHLARNLTESQVPGCYLAGLEFRHVDLEDFGEVLLLAKNARGTSDASFLLNVTATSSLSSSSRASSSSTGCQRWRHLVVFLWCFLWTTHAVHWGGS